MNLWWITGTSVSTYFIVSSHIQAGDLVVKVAWKVRLCLIASALCFSPKAPQYITSQAQGRMLATSTNLVFRFSMMLRGQMQSGFPPNTFQNRGASFWLSLAQL